MDQALIAYFDERFRELDGRFDERFRELDERFDGRFRELDGRFREIDVRFREIDVRFRETSQQIQALRQDMDRQFGEAGETARLTLVLVEGLRDEVHLVAEAVMGLDERLERVEGKGALSFETVRGWLEPYFKSAEERSREVDARSIQLDVPVRDLDNRVRTLEGWAARQGEEVKESLIKMVARYRAQPVPPPR